MDTEIIFTIVCGSELGEKIIKAINEKKLRDEILNSKNKQ